MSLPDPDLLTNLPRLQAILFDLDGTLVDTDDMAVARLKRRLRFLGWRAKPTARWMLMQAETPGNAVITLLDLLHLDRPLFYLLKRMRQREHEFDLVPGVAEMLTAVSPHYKLAIVTTRSRYHIDAFLAAHPEIAAMIETTCGLQDTRRLKPHPSPVALAAQRLGVPIERCLMVGDTRVDVLAARRAGAWSAGVLCGFGRRHELERAGAHAILDSTADLADFLGVAPEAA